MIHDEATTRQIDAANPGVSTWLSANAGSGKTRVLTDRVARLLLDGVSPQNVLCLTYTKAAATEMQNRLFKRLGEWSMKNDAELQDALAKLGVGIPDGKGRLTYARTLFARAIETPGGLRIQTIHSFCASLLRRFPLEAGVSPMFREMEERTIKTLRLEIIDEIANGDDAPVLRRAAQHNTGEDFDTLTREIISHRNGFAGAPSKDEIWAQFGLPPGFSQTDLMAQVFLGTEAELFRSLIPILQQSSKTTDNAAAQKLQKINASTPGTADLNPLFALFLYGEKTANPFAAKTTRFPTKAVQTANPDICAELHELMHRVETARDLSNGLNCAQKTLCLHELASVFLPLYDARKEARGWLDFDDLIRLAGKLLSDPAVAQWVLFRLDGGLDHILVDEAQDTSPAQWRVVKLLAQEFGAGIGARADANRTIFVVGDLKQSIFSFQGADPRVFESVREHFATSMNALEQGFYERSLNHSFRSSPAILNLVDATFEGANATGVGGPPKHTAFHENLPGRVDLWPIRPIPEAEEEKDWYDPTDMLAANDHRVILAEAIADKIGEIYKTGSIPGENGVFRRVQYDDFLILVQGRTRLFHEIIRACKSRDLPMAGADRLKVGAELAVKDLNALMAFLSMPDDNLALAAALRSPLFSMTEGELYDLAHNRPDTSLWSSLLKRQGEFPGLFKTLSDLRNQVDFHSPYELLERVLTHHNGRENLLARLGPEAEDGIDALLDLAISYEQSKTPSLTGFLIWLDSDDVEIKRQSDTIGERIRVMTTHGAKGLEAPIVILPDSGDKKPPSTKEIIAPETGALMWRVGADNQPKCMKNTAEQAQRAQEEEKMRLLYVALTRAEKWLIVCASGKVKDDGTSWYRQIEAGMTTAGAQPCDMPTGTGLRLQHGDWQDVTGDTRPDTSETTVDLPDWATTPAPTPPTRTKPVSPSDMGGAKSLSGGVDGLNEAAAMKRGQQIHLLLEHLPNHAQSDWPEIAGQVLAQGQNSADPGEITDLLAEAAAVLTNPAFSEIFAANTLAEVDISAALEKFAIPRIHGIIDRLVVGPTRVQIIDFKSNRQVPTTPKETPTGFLRQMGAYSEAIKQIYPNHLVEVAILWTSTATLMPLPHDIVTQALETPPHLDDPHHRP